MELALAMLAFVCAAVPAALFFRNLKLYRVPGTSAHAPAISVLIPARNEERGIAAAVGSVLANQGVEFEVIVLDDNSSDRTAAIVEAMAALDPRLHLESSPPLPRGWCGKQHACAVLARSARNQVLCFMDADVRLSPDALARINGFLSDGGAALVSGFPRQCTGTFLERLLLPLIHFVLLGFLPLARMRQGTHPAYAAGCGQLMVVHRDAYERSGGHAVIRETLHDGLKLPRAVRAAGFRTDLFDATPLARCRMYTSAREVWSGLLKNATEGLGAPARILPFTAILLAGQVLPVVLLPAFLAAGAPPTVTLLAGLAAIAAYIPRLAAARRFRQPLTSVLLHPLGIVVLLTIQWVALVRSLLGQPAAWKGRTYKAVG